MRQRRGCCLATCCFATKEFPCGGSGFRTADRKNLQESEEEEAPQESWDEGDWTLSIPPDMSASYQSDRSTFHSVEEQQVGLALDIGRHWCDQVKKEDQEATSPRLSRELLDEKEPEVLQDSLDRFYSTPCGYLEVPDLCQPYRSDFYSLQEQHLGLALDVDRIKKDQEEEEDQGPPCPRLSRELPEVVEPEDLQDSLDRCYSTPFSYLELPDSCQPYGSCFYSLEEEHVGFSLDVDEIEKYQEGEEDQNPPCPRLSRELPEVVEPEDLQDSLDRCYSTPFSYLELPDSCQPYGSCFYSLEEEHVGFSLDVDEIEKYQEGEEDQNPPCPRLSRELPEVVEPEDLQDSLDRCYSTPFSYLELPDSCQPYGSCFYSLEEEHVGFSLDVDEIEKYQEGEEDQNPPCPRLSRELPEVVEPEDLQDSLDRCYSTPFSYLELPDSCQPYGSCFYSLEEEHVGFSLDVDEIEKYQEGEEDQNPPCPRLNEVLMEAEEPEVLQDSLDRCYSTTSTYFQLRASFQQYRSAFYSFEEQDVSLALDVDNWFFTLTVIRHHLAFQMGVIFPH
ncbi:neuroblastoma breakpoint family member 9 isoform X4 [Gorilla gorilla gorilla]|uniref:neuroblastoma breakpoint family member 9 isoform X4 n=1 Tax=Gorilla gorilla gorilla TaxID=9595 RepID=UPI003008A5E2